MTALIDYIDRWLIGTLYSLLGALCCGFVQDVLEVSNTAK